MNANRIGGESGHRSEIRGCRPTGLIDIANAYEKAQEPTSSRAYTIRMKTILLGVFGRSNPITDILCQCFCLL